MSIDCAPFILVLTYPGKANVPAPCDPFRIPQKIWCGLFGSFTTTPTPTRTCVPVSALTTEGDIDIDVDDVDGDIDVDGGCDGGNDDDMISKTYSYQNHSFFFLEGNHITVVVEQVTES